MATVLISRAVKQAVEDRIRRMREAEMASFTPATITVDMSPFLEEFVWGEHLPLLPQLPEHWLHKAGATMRVKIDGVLGGGAMLPLKVGSEKVKMPPTTEYVPYMKEVEITRAQLYDPKWDRFTGITELRAAVVLSEEGEVVDARWRGVRKAITALLEGARSINEAVASVPALRLYLDNNTKTRLDTAGVKAVSNTKASRAARAASLVANIDVTGIASSGVAGTLILGNTK